MSFQEGEMVTLTWNRHKQQRHGNSIIRQKLPKTGTVKFLRYLCVIEVQEPGCRPRERTVPIDRISKLEGADGVL